MRCWLLLWSLDEPKHQSLTATDRVATRLLVCGWGSAREQVSGQPSSALGLAKTQVLAVESYCMTLIVLRLGSAGSGRFMPAWRPLRR